MSHELIKQGELPVSKYDDSAFDAVAKAGDWLPRIQLIGSNSDMAKEGKIQQGAYALITSKESFDDLTKEFHCLPLAWRPKAMMITGDGIVSVYNPADKTFADIQAKSDEKDSGCMFGPEYLVWVQSVKKFATFYFNSKTMRREAPNLKKLLGGAATVKSRLIKTQKFSWFGPVIVPCSTPFDVPSMDEIKAQVEKFNNPPESEVETAADDGRSR